MIIHDIWECPVSKLFWESFNDWLSNKFHIDPINLMCFLGQKKYMCVSDCMVFKIRVGRSGFFFFFFETCSNSSLSAACLAGKQHIPIL
jgi:hypothetical protein